MPHTSAERSEFDMGELAAAAAERTRSALSMLLGRQMVVERTHVAERDVHGSALAEHLREGFQGGSVTGRLSISGPPDGAAWVVFPRTCVEHLMEVFDMPSDTEGPGDEMRSMLGEIANIVTGSWLTELGDGWGTHLDPSTTNLDAGASDAEADARLADAGGGRAIAMGCSFADESGTYDLSVHVLFRTAIEDTTAHAVGM
jgi:chemotaxis protein CheY-P-specific phosphatase CheC